MKKKIEGELISIAHRILKLKNKADVAKLLEETRKLHDQLTLLHFYEENVNVVEAEISKDAFEEKVAKIVVGTIEIPEEELEEELEMEMASKEHIAQIEEELFEVSDISHTAFPKQEAVVENIVAPIEEKVENEENLSENEVATSSEEKNDFIPTPEVIGTKASKQISIDDLLIHDYKETEFVKKNDAPEMEQTTNTVETIVEEENQLMEALPEVEEIKEEKTEKAVEKHDIFAEKPLNFNAKTINLTLNDKIAFEKNLFSGNADDLNRVISQLNTFNSFDEAKSFVVDFVKPDYNNWQGKEEYETRFLELIENKFN